MAGGENLDVKIGPGASPPLATAGGKRGVAVGTDSSVPGADATVKGKAKLEGPEGQLVLIDNTDQAEDDQYIFEED